MLIVYCDMCGKRVQQRDLEAGTALLLDEDKVRCANCAGLPAPAAPPEPAPAAEDSGEPAAVPASATPHAPVSRSGRSTRMTSRGASERRIQGAPPQGSAAAVAVTGPDPKKMQLMLLVGGGGMAVLAALIFFFSGGKTSENTDKIAAASNAPEPVNTPIRQAQGEQSAAPTRTDAGPQTKAAQTSSTPVSPPISAPVATETQPEKESGNRARTLPSWMQEAASANGNASATGQPQKAEGEVVWIEDALPAGAVPDGTSKADSWKWISKPEPVFSGNLAHTQGGNEQGPGVRQHFFERAEHPLKVGPNDVLFTYVYLDPKNPPKEIMLQWFFQNSFEHRAYWGEDSITWGQNFSASRLPKGPLPKLGEWVRLEVIAAQLGVESNDEPVYGWAFTVWGSGTAYWDKAGVVIAPKEHLEPPVNVAQAQKAVTPTPPTRVETPPPAQNARPPQDALTNVTLGAGVTLAKVLSKDFKGGADFNNFLGQVKPSKAIWGKRSQQPASLGKFKLDPGIYDSGTLIINSLCQPGHPPCLLSIVLNGQEIYNGQDKARGAVWIDQLYAIPAGLLKAGENELQIKNLNDSNSMGDMWYMFNSAEIKGGLEPDRNFPPIISEVQQAQLQTYEHAFELLGKKDADLSAKLESALKLAKSAPDSGTSPLVAVLERATALNTLALANFKKNPPKEVVQVEKMKLKGVIERVEGSRAYIKEGNIEMPVDLSLLPRELFYKALNLDDSKPEGMADRAAYQFGLGNIEDAALILKKVKKENQPAWAALYEQHNALDRLVKFDAAVQSATQMLRVLKTTEALSLLNGLKKDYPELFEANKERMTYLLARAEKK